MWKIMSKGGEVPPSAGVEPTQAFRDGRYQLIVYTFVPLPFTLTKNANEALLPRAGAQADVFPGEALAIKRQRPSHCTRPPGRTRSVVQPARYSSAGGSPRYRGRFCRSESRW